MLQNFDSQKISEWKFCDLIKVVSVLSSIIKCLLYFIIIFSIIFSGIPGFSVFLNCLEFVQLNISFVQVKWNLFSSFSPFLACSTQSNGCWIRSYCCQISHWKSITLVEKFKRKFRILLSKTPISKVHYVQYFLRVSVKIVLTKSKWSELPSMKLFPGQKIPFFSHLDLDFYFAWKIERLRV